MSLRTAGKQSSIVLAAILLLGAWAVLGVLSVVATTGPFWEGGSLDIVGEAIGNHPFAGAMGLLVLLGFLGLLIVAYSALSEVEPVPDRFPPEDTESRSYR